MSHSYRKFPVVRQEKVDKKYWNKRLRRAKKYKWVALQGNQYRRTYSNDSNWHYRWSLEEAISDYHPSKNYPTLESWIEYWHKCCKYK
jgi:hypothetical protein